MTIKLSKWEKHFPDGISMATYQRIGRIIRERGTEVRIEMVEWTEEALRTALDKVENS